MKHHKKQNCVYLCLCLRMIYFENGILQNSNLEHHSLWQKYSPTGPRIHPASLDSRIWNLYEISRFLIFKPMNLKKKHLCASVFSVTILRGICFVVSFVGFTTVFCKKLSAQKKSVSRAFVGRTISLQTWPFILFMLFTDADPYPFSWWFLMILGVQYLILHNRILGKGRTYYTVFVTSRGKDWCVKIQTDS